MILKPLCDTYTYMNLKAHVTQLLCLKIHIVLYFKIHAGAHVI
jgi:hypothetical protein